MLLSRHSSSLSKTVIADLYLRQATSCYVTDNTELLLMRDAMDLLLPKLAKVIWNVAEFAVKWRGEPCLAYTHLQPGSCGYLLSNLPKG